MLSWQMKQLPAIQNKVSIVLLFRFQAISRHNPDKMKAYSAEAMPIAFLAMHEEKTEASLEIIAVWEEASCILSLFKQICQIMTALLDVS
jgi:hypothetical protein